MPKRLLPKLARLKAKGLLNMMYRPSELESELGLEPDTVRRRLVPIGLPHTKDGTNHIWINGREAAQWIKGLGQHGPKMADNHAYCLGCRKAVPLNTPTRIQRGKLTLLRAQCPDCGRIIHRGVKANPNG